MNELDTLRPAVRDAVERADGWWTTTHMDWNIIRAELLRLTDAHATLKAQSIHPRAQLLIMLGHANDRAERAESELAALKARIAEAPVSIVGRCALNSSPEYNIVTSCSPLDGKRVALVVLGEGE